MIIMVKLKIEYDKENDILFAYDPKRKSYGSIEIGDGIVIDFDKQRKVDAIELISATELLEALTQKKVTKENLDSITSAAMTTKVRRGVEIVLIMLAWANETIEAPLTLPNLRQKMAVRTN